MIETQSRRCLIHPQSIAPSRPEMRVLGVFNPAAADLDERTTVVLARVAEAPHPDPDDDRLALPRWSPDGKGLIIDRFGPDEYETVDARIVRIKASGVLRLTSVSHLRAFFYDRQLSDDSTVLSSARVFMPEGEMEGYGVEDPRITPLEGAFYVTYVAVSEHGACVALAKTTDFQHYERLGIALPPENKDALLFPERIDGKYAMLHRPNPNQWFRRPEMWFAHSADLVCWGGHTPLWGHAAPQAHVHWQTGRIGGGCPPVRVEGGWLEVYHANDKKVGAAKAEVGAYVAGALLLDEKDPAHVVAQTPRPIMIPEADFEVGGFVPNVVFPTAMLDRGDQWLVLYGAADTCSACATWSKRELLGALD